MIAGGSTPVIIMSTYNGMRYVAAQIDSIRAQTVSDWRLIVRDDGSRDDTVAILSAYAARDQRIAIVRGANIGVIESFFELLAMVGPEAPYVVLSDQDDIWHPTKLAVHASILADGPSADADVPIMNYSALRLVDEAGAPLPGQYAGFSTPVFASLLVENKVPGCTMAINQCARRLIVENLPAFDRLVMHDWWITTVISAFGKIVASTDVLVDYRQHGANVVGIKTGMAGQMQRARRVMQGRGGSRLLSQISELMRVFENRLSITKRQAIDRLLTAGDGNGLQRLVGSLDRSFFRTSLSDDIALRILLVGGHYRSGFVTTLVPKNK